MNLSDSSALSRREWMTRVSAPALALSLGAGMLGVANAASAADGPRDPGRSTGSVGARVYDIRNYGAIGS